MLRPGQLLVMLLYFILDALLCLIYSPCLLLVLAPFYLYRAWVRLLARLTQPTLIPIEMNDHLVAWDLLTAVPERRPYIFNVGCCIHVDGVIGLEAVQSNITTRLLDPINERGEKQYERLFHTLVLFGGHAFQRPVEKLDVKQKVVQLDLDPSPVRLNEFKTKWIGEGYAEGSPPWEVLVIPIPGARQTVLLFKWHHALLDGINMVNIMNLLMDDNVAEVPVKEREDSIIDKIRQGFRAPRLFTAHLYDIWTSKPAFSAFKTWNDYEPKYLMSKASLYFSDLKAIQRKTGTRVTTLNLALFGGVLRKLLDGREGHDYVHSAIPLPLPNHPVHKMCNHWTGGILRIPIKEMSSLERLKEMDTLYRELHEKELPLILNRFVSSAVSVLPTRLYQGIIERSRKHLGLRVLFSTMVNFAEGFHELHGHPVISITPIFGMYGLASGACYCHHDRCEFILNTTTELGRSQENLDSVLQTYLVNEVESLLQEVSRKQEEGTLEDHKLI